MTLLGKVLVYLTVALSFVMLAWALALYTHRIDWSNNTAKGEHPAGALVARKKRVDDAMPAIEVANTRWRQALHGKDGLLAWEKRNAEDREWYAAQLKAARFGSDGQGGQEVIKRVAIKDSAPVLDPNTGRPTLVDAERPKGGEGQAGGPLYCYQYYFKELEALTAKIQAQQEAYQKEVKRETELTQLASGPKPVVDDRIKEVAKERGLNPSDIPLRQRILDELAKLDRLNEELKDVASRQTNSVVDTELLLSRREQLERRIEELKKASEVRD
jgi:hypothetical protein